MPMAGLTAASLKKHPALIPLFVCVGAGCVWATYYIFRLALKSPDVQWSNKKGDIPNTRWPANKQYKFYAPTIDYSKRTFPEERPDI